MKQQWTATTTRNEKKTRMWNRQTRTQRNRQIRKQIECVRVGKETLRIQYRPKVLLAPKKNLQFPFQLKCVHWESLGIFEDKFKILEPQNWDFPMSCSSFWAPLYTDWFEALRTCVSNSSSSSFCWCVCLSCVCVLQMMVYMVDCVTLFFQVCKSQKLT